MKLITMLPPQQQTVLRRLRKRLANRAHMRRVREARKLLCVGWTCPSTLRLAGEWCTPRLSGAATAPGAAIGCHPRDEPGGGRHHHPSSRATRARTT